VGHGCEEQWLRRHIPGAQFTGILRGYELSRAYANMDLFAFYSETDTFGNVVLEALASGVPAVVTDKGGPKFIVENNRSGFVCATDAEFTACVLRLISSTPLLRDMSIAARLRAERASWDEVFASVYETYRRELPQRGEVAKNSRFRSELGSGATSFLFSSFRKQDRQSRLMEDVIDAFAGAGDIGADKTCNSADQISRHNRHRLAAGQIMTAVVEIAKTDSHSSM
jgi:hypothetical protein